MKHYPSILNYAEIGRATYQGMTMFVWDKLDGSNIRAEWTRKNGFWKFGKRNHLVGQDDPLLGSAQQLFLDKYGDDLDKIFRKERWDKAISFFEFFGPESFAGNHGENDRKDVVLFDVAANKKGFMPPREFNKTFGHLHLPNLVHIGHVNHEFADTILNGTCPGVTDEGVMCKGYEKGRGKYGGLVMFKIKSRSWQDRARQFYRGNEQALKDAL